MYTWSLKMSELRIFAVVDKETNDRRTASSLTLSRHWLKINFGAVKAVVIPLTYAVFQQVNFSRVDNMNSPSETIVTP